MTKYKIVGVAFIVLAWSALAAAATVDWYIWQDYGGTWADANKSLVQRNDVSMLCWAGAGSDVLTYGGWTPNTSLDEAQEIFNYTADHWDDNSGYAHWQWEWWFNNYNPDPGWAQNNGGGGFYTQYNFDSFYAEHQTGDMMATVEAGLRAGKPTAILTYAVGGHFLAVWGVRKDSVTGAYIGMWITESDMHKNEANPPATLDYYDLTNVGGVYHFTLNQKDWTICDSYTLDRAAVQWNGGTAAWNSTANWSKPYLPDATLRAEIDSGNAQISNNQTMGSIYSGFRNTGIVSQSAGVVTVNELHLGTMYSTSDGKYSISGGTLTADKVYAGETGTGRLDITNSGATVNINNFLQFGQKAVYTAVTGTNLSFNYVSSFKNAATTATNVTGLAETTFLFKGNGTTSVRTFEVTGSDLGAVVSGFTNNFHIKALTVGVNNSAYVRLVNNYVNYYGTPPGTYSEGLYIHTLTLNSGSTLDLNNYHVYVGTLNNYGTILNGTVIVVAGGQGGGPEMIPEPAAILMLLPALTGIGFFIRRKR